MTADEYCRELEGYLCRKNDGHLIRIVGPSFDRVTNWAMRGIPIKVACRGIDRYFERYYGRGPRRRPVRIDFCEADVLDAFDEWRRAVGVLLPSGEVAPADSDRLPAAGASGGDEAVRARARGSLPAHLGRIILRLTTLRSGAGVTPELDAALERAVRELDVARGSARSLRGDARTRLLARLEALDAELLAAARQACSPEVLTRLQDDAERELEAFRARMPEAAYRLAVDAAVGRLLRDAVGLPTLSFD
jgi:hypothetical protein